MQFNIQIPTDEMTQALADGIGKLLYCEHSDRSTDERIIDAIRDGVAQAISERLSKNWGDELITAIAEGVAKTMPRGST